MKVTLAWKSGGVGALFMRIAGLQDPRHGVRPRYLDVDTVSLRSLAPVCELPPEIWGAGYDGSPWGEVLGTSCVGPCSQCPTPGYGLMMAVDLSELQD